MEKILELLQERAEITVDLLNAVLLPPGEFIRDTHRFYREGPRRFKTNWAERYRKRQMFYSLLNQLKRDGLVIKKQREEGTLWRITKKGLKKLEHFQSPERRSGGIPVKRYTEKPAAGLVIVAFDIPEKQRKKRQWLRDNLAVLNLKLLQKSVWVGTTSIPEEFVRDLRAHEILSYIQIFSVNKKGTIERTA